MMCHPNYKFTCDIRINWDGIDQKKQKPSHWIKDQWAYEQRRLALSAPVFDTCLIRFLSLIARCCQCVYCTRVKNTGDVTISSHLMNNVQSEIKLLCKYCWCFLGLMLFSLICCLSSDYVFLSSWFVWWLWYWYIRYSNDLQVQPNTWLYWIWKCN